MHDTIEHLLIEAINWIKLVVEATGAILVLLGTVLAITTLLGGLLKRRQLRYHRTRFRLARYLVLALEFQLAADILATAISPDWDAIGKLAAIAVIRTVLNFFLVREEREEEEIASGGGPPTLDTYSKDD